MQKNSGDLVQLTDGLSSHAMHVLLHIALHWPHRWEMKDSELCFQNEAGSTVFRLYKYTNEGLTVGKDAAVASHVKQALINGYQGKEVADAVSLSFADLSAADVPEFVELLLSPESVAAISN